MSEYQYLTSTIQVPKEWPLKTTGSLIIKSAKQVIKNHQTGMKICLTVADVSALVTDNENGPGYIFKKIDEIHEDTGRVDLIVPVKTEIVMPEPNLLGPTGSKRLESLPMAVKHDHPISRMLVGKSLRHLVLTAAPLLEDVLKEQGIKGPEKYDYALRSIYIINNKTYNDVLLKKLSDPSQSIHPAISIKHIKKDKWIIDYYDCFSQY